jgi:WD40 repeat protein
MSSSWTLFRFDPVEYISYLSSEIKDLENMGPVTSESTFLRNIIFWSTAVVRGLYLSNFLVSPDEIPKEMNFKTNSEKLCSMDLIKRECPKYTDEDHGKTNLHSENTTKNVAEVKIDTGKDVYTSFKRSKKNKLQEDSAQMEQSLKEIEKKSRSVMKITNEDIMKSTIKRMELTASRISENSKHEYVEPLNLELKEINSEILRKNMENVNREFTEGKKEIIKTIFRRDGVRRVPLLPDPIMHLKFILGFTAQSCPGVEFQVDGKKSLVFASGTTLVRYDYEELRQKFYFGHSKSVTNYTFACEGEILFSCQEGKNAIIRVWKSDSARCIKMVTTPYEKIYSMSCTRDSGILCTVGLESINKDTIILWDISNLDDIKVIIRQSSHFSINCVKFSPFDHLAKIEAKLEANTSSCAQFSFATCGKENIKFWRVKNNHLGGKAVVLNQYARDANFLCMDYDNPLVEESSSKRLFVGSNKGCIFQISATSQELEAIFKIQDQAILSLKLNDAFCATGSLDGYLRIWPIDFKEFLIEAKHDSGVCSVDISHDAMNIICGTLNGSVGMLNIQTKEYKTVLRTPPSQIKSLDASHDGDYLFTIEEDKSIRVWDVEQKSEAFQFVSSKDPPTAIGVPTTSNTIFACGFTSGALKIFDLINTSILYECKSFNSAVSKIKFIQKDALLLVMNIQGNISIHDCLNQFIQIKLIKIDEPSTYTDLSITLEEEYFATIGPESNCVIVWNANTFGMKNRIPITNFFVKKIDLINRNLLCVVLENCNVQFYSLAAYEGVLIREFVGIHSECINHFLHTKNFKFFISGGAEGMIKIWDFKMLYKSHNSYQQFIGHTNGIKGIVCIEQKSLVVTCSENSGIFFWNFLGDVTFCESEITSELEKLGNMKDVKIMLKTLSDPKKTVFEEKSSSNLIKNIRSSHLEKTYNRDHNQIDSRSSRSDFNQKRKINFDPSLDEQVSGILYMLPIGQEENLLDVNMINMSGAGYVPNDSGSIFNVVNENLESKLLFVPKFLPTKLEKM